VGSLTEYLFSLAKHSHKNENHTLGVIYRHTPLPNWNFCSTEMCCTPKYGTRLEQDFVNLFCFSSVPNRTDIYIKAPSAVYVFRFIVLCTKLNMSFNFRGRAGAIDR
jgi:hypothetical protein